MNDYEKLARDVQHVIDAAEALDAVDPDIERMIESAVGTLRRCHELAEERA